MEQISIKEADTVLLTVSRATNGEIPDNIDYPEYVDKRLITICHLYCKIHEKVNRCLRICALTELQVIYLKSFFFNLN